MVCRTSETEPDPVDRDERLGEAIEAYLALTEAGQAPEPAAFAAGYADLEEDLAAALEGLALVQGLVGEPIGPGHRLESGQRVAGYRIVRELGRGGMGIVYEAVHVGLDRPVALKVLGSLATPDSSGRRRFLNEARTAAGLHHTHIVPVFDVGQVGGLCYYAMQRIEGSGLDRVIKHLRSDRTVAAGSTYTGRPSSPSSPITAAPHEVSAFRSDLTATWDGRGPSAITHDLDDEPTPFIPPRGSAYYRWVARVGKQAAEALAHAHQHGVIHRDVKPSNLLVDAQGVIWMADFGLARRLADPSQTQLDSLLGTPRYMSPEQAQTGPIDGRSDVYSLGATLYELLTLRPPFDGKSAAELIDQIATREPVPLHQFDPKLPPDLETIVLKALHKRVGDRYASAGELADDLERYLNHEPVRARRIGPIGRAWRVARRHPSLTIVTTVATATVIGSSTFFYVRVLHERDEARHARSDALDAAIRLQAANIHVLHERDEARHARSDAQEAAIKLEVANNEARSALRSQLIQNAEVVRLSVVAGRRLKGLELLKRAATLPSHPGQQTQVRDEAVAFLAIRDVEKRPEIAVTERPQGLVFGFNGRRLATLSEDLTTVRFWDVESRTLIETHDLNVGLTSEETSRGRGPRRLGIGPFPGTRIAAAGNDVAIIHPDGKSVRLFNATTGAISGNLRLFNRPDPIVGPPVFEREILSMATSADGRRLVTIDRGVVDRGVEAAREPRNGRSDVRVNLWDMMNPVRPLKTLYEVKPDSIARFHPPLIAISPDGAIVAVAGREEAEVNVFTHDGQSHDTIDSQAELTALALGPEGLLAAAGNRAVHVWDLDNLNRTRASLPSLTHNLANVDLLRFSPDDGTLLTVAGRDSSVEIWDVAATTKVATLPLPSGWHGLAMAAGSNLLAVGEPKSLALWAVVNPAVQTQIAGFPDPLKTLAFAPDGELAMLGRNGTLRLWHPDRCPTSALAVEAVRAWAIAFDAQGRLITNLQDRIDPGNRPTTPSQEHLDQLALPDLKPVASVSVPELRASPEFRGRGGLRFTVGKMVLSKDKRTLVMIRANEVLLSRLEADGALGAVVRLESSDLPHIATLDPPTPPLGPNNLRQAGRGDRPSSQRLFWRDVAISPAGDRIYLLSGPNDEISAWTFQSHRLERLPWTLPTKVSGMALAADGSVLAVGDRSGTVFLIDPATGEVRHRLAPPEGDGTTQVGSLAFSPDGRELAVGTNDQVRLWSLRTAVPSPYLRLPGHRGPGLTLAYDLKGRRLASGGDDRAVKVWDLDRIQSELNRLGLDVAP